MVAELDIEDRVPLPVMLRFDSGKSVWTATALLPHTTMRIRLPRLQSVSPVPVTTTSALPLAFLDALDSVERLLLARLYSLPSLVIYDCAALLSSAPSELAALRNFITVIAQDEAYTAHAKLDLDRLAALIEGFALFTARSATSEHLLTSLHIRTWRDTVPTRYLRHQHP